MRWLVYPLCVVLPILGCGRAGVPPPPVDVFVIDKASLDGEWWHVASVDAVDFPPTGYLSGITLPWPGALLRSSSGTRVTRIRWEITEDFLYGRPVGAAVPEEATVAYPIAQHRNPSGESAPWSERTHMRVDWSFQLALGRAELFGPSLAEDPSFLHFNREPVPFFDERPFDTPPQARHEAGYFEWPSQELWTLVADDGAAFWSYQVQTRHNFLRVPPDHDPAASAPDLPGFGVIANAASRLTPEPPTLTGLDCTRDAECESSRCDPIARRCQPARAARPLDLVLSHRYPFHLRRGAFEAVAQWNEAFMEGQRALNGRAAPRGGPRVIAQSDDPSRYCFANDAVSAPEAEDGSCAPRTDFFVRPSERGQDEPYDCWVVGPEEPSRPRLRDDYGTLFHRLRFEGAECVLTLRGDTCDGDPAACARLGDPRHAIVSYVPELVACGVAQPSMDPLTGAAVGGMFHIGGSCLEGLAWRAVGVEALLRGESTPITSLDGYREWQLGALESDSMIPTPPTSTPSALRVSTWEIPVGDEALAALAGSLVEAHAHEGSRAGVLARLQVEDPMRFPRATTVDFEVDLFERVSTFRGGPLRVARERDRELRALAESLIFVPRWGHAAPSQHVYWARALPDEDAALFWEQMLHRAMVARLVGHALGLTPNLAASLDRAHYPPAYDVLDAREPLPDPAASDADGDGRLLGVEADLHRRRFARARQRRLHAGVGQISSASVLDIHGDLSDLAGVGAYDRAAVLASFFDLRETPRGLRVHYAGGDPCATDSDCPFGPGRAALLADQRPQRCVDSVCTSFAHDHPDAEAYASCLPFDDGPSCLLLDAGASLAEVVHHYRESWLDLYPITHIPSADSSVLPSVTSIAIPALLRISSLLEEASEEQLEATREAFAWLVELLVRAPEGFYRRVDGQDVFRALDASGGYRAHLRHPRHLTNSIAGFQRVGLSYDRIAALAALTTRSFDAAPRLSFFDRFDASRDTVLYGSALGRAERFAPRLYPSADVWHAIHPDPLIGECGSMACVPRVEETYGTPIAGHLDRYRELILAHAYAEAPVFADGSRPAWIALVTPETRFVGDSPCAYGAALGTDPLCERAEDADYVVYLSEPPGVVFAASAHPVGPRAPRLVGQRPPGFDLLVGLVDLQRRISTLEAIASPTLSEREELERLRQRRSLEERLCISLRQVQELLGAGSWLPR